MSGFHLSTSPILIAHFVVSRGRDGLPGQTHLNSDAKIADEGCPQGGEGTHKGCPYLLFSAKKPASSRQRRMEFAIAHYDLHSSRRYALRRAPTRGAPTRFRQPHVGLSQFDAIALDGLQTELKLKPVTEIRTCLSASNSTRLSHGEGFPHISGADNQASRQRALFSFSLFRFNRVRADLTALPPIHALAPRPICRRR